MKPINTTNNTKNNRSPYNNRQYDNHHQQRLIANSSDISKSNRSTKSSVEMRRNWSSKLFPSLKFCNLFLPIICITSSIINLILIHQLYRFVERVKLDIEHTMSTAQGYVILESNQTHVALTKHRVPRSLDQEIDIPQFEQSNTEQQQVKLGQFIIPVQVPVEVISTFCQESENYCRRNHAMLKGEKGECGEAGPKGEPGLRGPMGATGFPGVNGEKGDKGDRGERGYIGFPGAQGPPGQAGPHGQMGYTGLSGPQGLPGHPGLMGKVGPKGEKGDRGPQGLRGTKGMKADPGISRKHPNVPSQNIVPQTRSSMKKREKECLLDWIGIPILVREMKINNSIIKYGAWMKDQLPKTGDQQKYVYVTVNNQGNKIYEYENEKSISKRGKWRRVIELPVGYEYYGCGHIIVHGNFIFHRANTSTIVSANINIGTNNDTVAEIVAERNIFDEPWVSDNKRRLYQDPKIGCFDFALYDGSIWVTFKEASGDSDRLVVLKLARDTLEFRGVRYDIAIEPTILVNTFLAYGMLYGVHSYDDHTTYVQLAFDVVEGKTLTTVDLKLTVPYKSLAQLSYDPYTRRLYAWDDGRLIYYMYNVKASQSKC